MLTNKTTTKKNNAVWLITFCLLFVSGVGYSADQAPERVDIVASGKQAFIDKGCIECHGVKKGDTAFKSGPNLYGLFQKVPKIHKVQLKSGVVTTIEADGQYFKKALIAPTAELAIQENGPEKGKPYLPIMPKIGVYGATRNAIFAYLKTLNEPQNSGPKQIWQTKKAKKVKTSPYDNELWVGKQATFSRHNIEGVSTRTLHIALPNHINYSFDTKDFTIKKIWSGGFLDITPERSNRGRGLNSLGKNAQQWKIGNLLTPLTQSLQPVDLSFKNWPTFNSENALEKFRIKNEKANFSKPYLSHVKQAKGQFLGLDHTNKQQPILNYQIEGVEYQQTVSINHKGVVSYQFSTPNNKQRLFFAVNNVENNIVNVSHGTIKQGVWTIPPLNNVTFSIALQPKNITQLPEITQNTPAYTHDIQTVVFEDDKEAKLPAGYQAQSIMAPKDRFGRAQLFEPLGLDFAENGTAVVASRTAGIWKIKNNQWHFFADGFYDPLGIYIEDKEANQIVVAHKPELTRVIDRDQDGYADLFNTINDDWRYAGNYCEYVHGPVPDGKGGYFLNLNLAHGGDKVHGGPMGTFGGYDGWLVNITKAGQFIPWASGLRSPAGLGYGPNETLLYTDNQGVFVGTSKMHIVKKDTYYGYPASLKDDEAHRGKKIDWQDVNKQAELATIHFPHGIVASSPGNPSYDHTKGKFGPFAEQILVGDQSLSNISRVELEQVNGQWQGVVIPFMSNLKSGVMRLSFAPDNSLWVGQTGRGWSAKGGNYEALQRIRWDGKTMPFEIKTVKLAKNGFNIYFTDELANANLTTENIEVKSWYYQDTDVYGSPRYDLKERKISHIKQTPTSVTLQLDDMEPGLIYEITLKNVKSKKGLNPSHQSAYYTLHKLK